jgi:hypothetical protein
MVFEVVMETCVLQGLEQLVLFPRYIFITLGSLKLYVFVFMPISLSSVFGAPTNQPLLCFCTMWFASMLLLCKGLQRKNIVSSWGFGLCNWILWIRE